MEFIDKYNWKGIGRKPAERLSLTKAFTAKPIFKLTQTSMLIDAINSSSTLRRLCGWETRSEIPSDSTFSRAFNIFAETELPQRIHEAIVKKNSKGKTYKWRGYKLHLDCVDGDIPVSAVVTSASVHDSQVAIPLSQMSNNRITNLYDLMDAAYDAPEIHAYSKEKGRIPIIDHNPRRGTKKEMDPAKALRHNERSGAERVNSELKDNYALESIRVRGQKKVACQIMFAIVALTAKNIFYLLPQLA